MGSSLGLSGCPTPGPAPWVGLGIHGICSAPQSQDPTVPKGSQECQWHPSAATTPEQSETKPPFPWKSSQDVARGEGVSNHGVPSRGTRGGSGLATATLPHWSRPRCLIPPRWEKEKSQAQPPQPVLGEVWRELTAFPPRKAPEVMPSSPRATTPLLIPVIPTPARRGRNSAGEGGMVPCLTPHP